MTCCLSANWFLLQTTGKSKAFSEAVRAVVLPADLMELGYNKAQGQEIVVCYVKEIKLCQHSRPPNSGIKI